MKNITWSNTMLVAYLALPKIAKIIDFSVKTRVNSGFQSKHLRYGVQTEDLFNEIIELNDQKRKVCNLKVIINEALSLLSPTYMEIIKLRFFEKKTFQEIAELTNVVLRTVFRRYDRAIEEFDGVLQSGGWTEEWFEREYGNIEIFRRIKKRLEANAYLTKANIN